MRGQCTGLKDANTSLCDINPNGSLGYLDCPTHTKCQGNGGVYINSGCWPRLLGKKSFVAVSAEFKNPCCH